MAQDRAGIPSPKQPGTRSSAAAQSFRLTYSVFAHGFRALAVTADLQLTPDGYSVVLHDHTAGFIGFMVHTDVTSIATGHFARGGVAPVSFETGGYSRGAKRHVVLDYPGPTPAVRVLTPPEPNRDPVPTSSTTGSIDTLSAIVDLFHRVQATGQCEGRALIFDGLRLTQAAVQTAGREAVPGGQGAAYSGEALRCDFTTQQLGGFLHNEDEARMRRPQHGSAWLMPVLPGIAALPVRIVFQNPKLGLATMVLTDAQAGAQAGAQASPPADAQAGTQAALDPKN